jgi:hypothetical protein
MSLSQQEFADLREAYANIYAPKFETILDELTDEEVDEISDELIEEVVEEFFAECLEEGWDVESVEETLCESLDASIQTLNESVLMEMNPYAPAGSKESRAYNKASTASKRSAERAAKRKEVIGKVKSAVKNVGSALKSGAKAAAKGAVRGAGYAAGAAGRVASTAKSEFKKGYERGSKGSSSSSSDSSDSGSSDSGSTASSSTSSSSGSSSSGRTRKAVGGALRSVGRLLKKGLKKAVGGTARAVSKGADKVATRLGEEAQQLDEISDKKVQKVVNARNSRLARSMDSGAPNKEFHQAWKSNKLAARRNERTGSNVKVDSNLAKEEFDIFDVVLEFLQVEGYAETLEEAEWMMVNELDSEDINSILEGSYEDRIAANNKKYDANRKRAAQRAAARNAARDAGQTGAVPGVGYVTPRKERETYTDSAGKTRHAKGL